MKIQKTQISLSNYLNADGSDKFLFLVIGSALQPYCFTANKINMASLDIIWRHNKKAWMTIIIILNWLTWFDKRMSGKKILFLINSFSTHKAAIQTILKNGFFKNTCVKFLPLNCTSIYQSLDQGIIANFKLFYQRYWMWFIVKHLLKN